MRPLRFAFVKANYYNRQAAMKPKKIVYYNDPLNDDFAGNNIKDTPFPKKLKYRHPKNPIWWFFSELFYHFLAVPILWLVGKLGYGVKVIGKKNVRAFWRRGVFFYGNHTQITDAWIPQCFFGRWRRSFIMADKDAISIKGIRTFVMMLGCLPMPDAAHAADFKEAVAYHYHHGKGIVVYPERHIWPYATHIRPFTDDPFTYPAELGAPVVPFCTTYRKARFFGDRRPPKMTVYISRPIYPDMDKSLPERKKELRDRVYQFMLDKASEEENIEYIAYIKKEEPHASNE